MYYSEFQVFMHVSILFTSESIYYNLCIVLNLKSLFMYLSESIYCIIESIYVSYLCIYFIYVFTSALTKKRHVYICPDEKKTCPEKKTCIITLP